MSDLASWLTRRELLRRSGGGFGLLGLAGVMSQAGLLNSPSVAGEIAAPGNGLLPDDGPQLNLPLAPRQPHFAPKARHVVHLFMNGGPSQVDTFDHKPMLEKFHGKTLPVGNLRTERKTGHAMKSPFRFEPCGESGLEVSELFSRTAAHIDDICVIRSMQAEVPNHEPSLMLMNCGHGLLAVPSMGAWVT